MTALLSTTIEKSKIRLVSSKQINPYNLVQFSYFSDTDLQGMAPLHTGDIAPKPSKITR
jgi:hypothetical protein